VMTLPRMLKKRRSIQAGRTASIEAIEGILSDPGRK
jgi:hypothetical protein